MPETTFTGDGFTVSRVVVGPIDNNVYLVRDAATDRGLLIDAAADPEAIVSLVDGTHVDQILTTHGHWDHHQAIPEVAALLGVQAGLHPADAAIADKSFDFAIAEGPVTIGNTVATVVHTPGHTPGSVCIKLDGVVLTGDTLFPGGPGATRFDHSDFAKIIESIAEELFTLDDGTVVLPGHGAATTIGVERPQLPEWIVRGW
jgi:glyoxylase-like metal-dependent hydrolase (beta-lactamase superfamily II)